MVVLLIIVVGVLPLLSAQVTVGPVTSGQGDVDWRPCGDFPWDNGDVTVDCDYSYVEVKQWHSWSGTPPDDPVLVLRGRCTVTCPVGADVLVGPPYSDYSGWDLDDGAYYCNAGNSTWMGTEPVCLGCSKEQERAMQRVQQRALRIISRAGRRDLPDLPTLQSRREDAAVKLFRQMLDIEHPLHDLVPASRSTATGRSLRNKNTISIPPARTKRLQNSFLHTAIKLYNKTIDT
ncbi:uncharacterized protein LOC118427088 [Branchiostoma floridae]|uniref:Uncharacterized protein LOC118427088 n=1 Tax=Branchiostoma floridae TaxID=7739 RepID=A0A9J7M268_BRAFL|nr:uncharacterized protein LOC118427088 [Branchiostoma floridae]